MVTRKKFRLGIIVSIVVIILLLMLLFIPVTRIVTYQLFLKSSPLVTYRILSDNQSYAKWYSDSGSIEREYLITADEDSSRISYQVFEGESRLGQGGFQVRPTPDGGSLLKTVETLYVNDVYDKLRYFFSPSSFKPDYNRKVDRLKSFIEEPAWESAGIRFIPSMIPAQSIASYGDSVPAGTGEARFMQFYRNIITSVDTSLLFYPQRPQSRYKISESGNMFFQVGIPLKDSNTVLKAPLQKLDVPAVKIIVGAFKGKYEELPDAIEIMKDWIKKQQLVVASHPWIEHKLLINGDHFLQTDSMYIIQPVYFYPKK